jgi:hypothetical protein
VIRCFCCERRLSHSLVTCACDSATCPRCLLCEGHCTCVPVPVVVREVKADEALAGGRDDQEQ